MSCINKSHPEFKTLLKNSKENPASLAADIGVWMDNNTSERFPTLEELNIKKTILGNLNSSINWAGLATDFETKFYKEKNTTSKKILGKLLPEVDPKSSLHQVITKLNKLDFPVKFLTKNRFDNWKGKKGSNLGAYMFMVPSTKTIYLNDGKIRNSSGEQFVKSFLHEMIHAYTINSFTGNLKGKQGKELTTLFNIAKNLDTMSGNPKDFYGFTDEYEFVSEIFTNKNFAEHIKSLVIKEDNKKTTSVWEQFIEWVTSLFFSTKSTKDELDVWSIGGEEIYKKSMELIESLVDQEIFDAEAKQTAERKKDFEERQRKNEERQRERKKISDFLSNNEEFIITEVDVDNDEGEPTIDIVDYLYGIKTMNGINTKTIMSEVEWNNLNVNEKHNILTKGSEDILPPLPDKPSEIFYQRDSGKNAQKQAKKIFFDEIQNKDLSEYDIGRINNKLKEISRSIGDVDWNVRLSAKGNYYIAGYDNNGVTYDTYFSPYADRAFSQLSSKEDSLQEGSKYNKLELKLEKWAKKNGISIRALESVVKQFPDRYNNDAVGISDFANSLIALADNRNTDTLAEEVAHFAIEMMLDTQKGTVNFLGVQDIKTLLKGVENTEVYQDVLKEYEGVYTNKLDFQKEALAKLLATQLLNQFESSQPIEIDPEESENGFWQLLKYLSEAFQTFVENVFGMNTSSRKDLENDLIPLANSILEGKTISEFQKFKGYTKADIKYQLDEELKNTPKVPENIKVSNEKIKSKESFLETARKRLQVRLQEFDRGRLGSEKQLEKFEKVISDLERNIALKEWDVAVTQFINSAAEELTILDTILQEVLDPDVDRNLSSNSIHDAREFLKMYEGLFADFKEQSYEAGFSKEKLKEFNDMVNPITILIANSQKRMNVLAKLDSVNTLTTANLDYNGEVIDKDFNPKEIGETSTTDTNKYRLWSGNLKNAASGIIRAVHSMIFNSIANVKRFTAYTARDILNSQTLFLTKYVQEALIEKDSEGNLTQGIIQEHHMGKYYKAVSNVKSQLAKKLNIKNEEGEYDYNKIIVDLLSPEDQKVYKKTWEKFYLENSIAVQKNAIKYVANDAGKLVVKTKMIKFGETKYVTEDKIKNLESKGYSVVTFTKNVPNQKYLNKDFQKKIKDPIFKSHYDLLIKTQRESIIAKLPFKYQRESLVYMNPSILKSNLDRLIASDAGSFLERIKLLGQDAILVEEDDTQFGDLNEFRKNAVPIFFTKKMDDISKLSFDIGRNIIMMSEMSENFRQMNLVSGKVSNIESTIGNREYEQGRGKNKTLRPEKGVGTTDYETIKFLKETFVLGKEMNDWSTEINISEDSVFAKAIKKITLGKIDISGKNTLSWTKMLSKFATYIRNGNLGFNAPTAFTGQLTATGDSIIQDQIGLYTTHESKNFARKIFVSELPEVLSQMGQIKQTSKMHLIMLDNEVLRTADLIQDSGRGRLLRKGTINNAMYLFYSTGDYAIKSRITVAIYDNYRLHKGQFITRENFYIKTAEESGVENNSAHKKAVSSEWSDLREKSLWNAYEQVDGALVVKENFKEFVTPELLNSVKGKIEHVTHNVDGTLSKTDKGKLAKTALGAFPLMHRGFLINLLDRKFRGNRTNFVTQEEEIGEYVASANFLREATRNALKGNMSVTGVAAAWEKLSPARKRGVYKTALDLIYLNFAAFIAGMLLKAADDDEDEENWPLQFAALLAERWVLEVSAGWSPNEFIQIVKEPVVGARVIEEISSITSIMFDDDPIESGMYKGKTKLNKWGVKRLPYGFKNIYEIQYPEEKNKFIKKMVGPGFYYTSDEQDFAFSKWLMNRFGNSDTYNFGEYDEDTKKRIMEEGISDLELEEDYNGWN